MNVFAVADLTGQAAERVLSATGDLVRQGETLRTEVSQFLANIRTA